MVRIWHGVMAVLVTVALVGQLTLTIRDDRSVVNFFSYFTIQSNILVLVACVLLVLRPARDGTLWRAVRLAGLVGITVTGIVYATVLAGAVSLSGAARWYNVIFHYETPLAALLGYLLWSPRTLFHRRDVVFVVWPVLWVTYTLVRGAVTDPRFAVSDTQTSHYPYLFLDVDRHGAGSVAVSCLLVTVLALAIAAAYGWAGHRLERTRPRDA